MINQSYQANGRKKQSQLAPHSIKNDQNALNSPKIQIKVTIKKKKEVINLQSSSEKSKNLEEIQDKSVQRSPPKEPRRTKVKKVQHKCQLCKGSGRKAEMKKCSQCKHYTHLHCLDDSEAKGRFTCDKCKAANHVQQSKANKKQKKAQEKNQIAKSTQKKIDKQKKKDQSNRVLEQFKEKYPFYVGEGDKIKFPIEDKLLFIYKEYFESSQTRVVPIDHPLIPSKYLGDLLEIQNFIVSFASQIEEDYNGDYKKTVLYVLMNCNGPDRTFQRLLGAIIKIYLKDIFLKNKTQNVKILNDNCFFILLGTINQAQQMFSDYVALTAPQIIRQLSTIPSMRNSFKNFIFPEKLNLQSKLKVLISLIQGLSQVDGFHQMVGRKSEKISEMTKDKADYVIKLKKNEAQALSNKQKLKQMIGKVNKYHQDQNQLPQQQRQKDKNVSKQMEKTKKKTQKLANQGEVSERIIKQFRSKIVTIAKRIPFVISEILFLGSDRNDSNYYFYLRQPHRIYVRYRAYLLDDKQQYKIYETKQKILELLKTLNTKGTHQKRLYQSIHNLIKQQIIRNQTDQDQMPTEIGDRMIQQCVFLQGDIQFRDKIVNDVMEIEQKFSNYLAIKNYRWANDTRRQQFRFGFPYIEDLQAMKQQIKALQESFLFVEVVRQRQIIREQSDSNEQVDKEGQSNQKQLLRRKKPIRIWGINSERIKKFWIQYLQICINYTGVWISVHIFKNYVDKYIEKKMQHIREQQKRDNDMRQKQERQRKIRIQKQKEKQQRNLDRLRSSAKYTTTKTVLKKNRQTNSISMQDENVSESAGIRTRRKLRASNRVKKPLTIDSDDEYVNQEEEQGQNQEESSNDDQCNVCHNPGEVICCDTCPKVFHLTCLGLKETPEGEWSCIDCLYKINNSRQTRSRAKKMGK